MEVLKGVPKVYQDPNLWAWLDIFHPSVRGTHAFYNSTLSPVVCFIFGSTHLKLTKKVWELSSGLQYRTGIPGPGKQDKAGLQME